MRTLGNILWHFPFFGFVTATLVYLFGFLLTISVIGAPIGLGLTELGRFLFRPFGNAMVSSNKPIVEQNTKWQEYSTIVMMLYIPFGIVFTIIAFFQVIGLFVSIVGIPPGLVLAKSLGTILNPVNKVCVPAFIADRRGL